MKKLGSTLIAAIAVAFASAAGGLTVKVNGDVVKFPDGQPTEITGRVMVPLRGVFEAMNAYVEYDPRLKTIRAKKGNEEIELMIGDKVGKKNGAEIMIEVAPVIRNGSTLVPLRFLAEALGGNVDYDKATRTVDINYKNP